MKNLVPQMKYPLDKINCQSNSEKTERDMALEIFCTEA